LRDGQLGTWYCRQHAPAIPAPIDDKSVAAPAALDLKELVARFGGYNNITPEAWAQCDAELAAYQGWLRRK
jgi:hypothetical protein